MRAFTLQSITAENNKAVAFLQRNKPQEALSCLRQGIQELQHFVKEDANDGMELDDHTPPSQAEVHSVKIGSDDLSYAPGK